MTDVTLARVILRSYDGVGANDCVNDLVFEQGTRDTSAIQTAIESFYNTVQTIPDTDYAVGAFISNAIKRATNGCNVAYYNLNGHLDGSDTGSPVATTSWTLAANQGSGTANPPEECAATLSFHGDLTGIVEKQVNPSPPPAFTRPAARRRGRIYLGPLNELAFSTDGNGHVHVSTPLKDTLAAAATILKGAVSDGWRVWSRANAAVYNVTGGWIDDGPDTVRKRGPKFTSKTFF